MSFVILCSLIGCQPSKRKPDPEPPTAADVAERYNARVARIERIRARAVVDVRWTDKENKRHAEQGDGVFQYRRPDRFALTVGDKFGTPYYWLGCDPQRFWWIDMNPNDESPDTAYVGGHETAYGRTDPSQLLIPPLQLIELLGITPLPPQARRASVEPDPDSRGAVAVYRFPVKFAGRVATQEVRIGALTGLPREVAFYEPEGRLIARSRILDHHTLPVRGAPHGPEVPASVHIWLPDHDVELKLRLESFSSDEQKIMDNLFDFEAIASSRGVTQVVHLDER